MREKKKILLAMPHNGTLVYGAAQGLFRASARHEVKIIQEAGSNLAGVFNVIWCRALNLVVQGEATHLAFLHADIAPEDCWIDKLAEVMDECGADMVSAISPIKDCRGMTSTGIGLPGLDFSPMRRFTLRELADLPETFDAQQAGYPEKVLLHNTGCWLANLGSDVFHQTRENGDAKLYFTLRDRVYRDSAGVWHSEAESEDWFFSRRLHDLGANTVVTQRVKLTHYGAMGYVNDVPWGSHSVDLDNERHWLDAEKERYIHENGWWIDPPPEWHAYDENLVASLLTMIPRAWSVLDLGCGDGRYVAAMVENWVHAAGVDGTPGTDGIPHCTQGDLTQAIPDDWPWPDWTLCLEVGEHVPRDREEGLLDRIARCVFGAVVSWAHPGQPGRGHVNCRTEEEVVGLLEQRGLEVNRTATQKFRKLAVLDYFKQNLLVFHKR